MDKKKLQGVVYTPKWIVDKVTTEVPSYENMLICDPACGNGNFLVSIAEYIFIQMNRCSDKKIKERLYFTLKNLTGMDIDNDALKECENRLDEVVKFHSYDQVGYDKIEWNLKQLDALNYKEWNELFDTFDCVVGNPPYIRIQNFIDRSKIDKNWQLASGCYDMYILYFELGLKLLKSGGTLSYITPNSWLKNKSTAKLRNHLLKRHKIDGIVDFGNHLVFDKATTYTAITVLTKGGRNRDLTSIFGGKCTKLAGEESEFAYGFIDGLQPTWSVLTVPEIKFMNTLKSRSYTLEYVSNIIVGIQTLADKVFIFNKNELDIEPEITRPIIRCADMDNKDLRVIYPYNKNGNTITEDELRTFPKAYAHLQKHLPILLNRDGGQDNPYKWYEYGRRTSIISGFGEKILTAIMNKSPNFQLIENPDCLFYSGYAIKPKNWVNTSILLEEINSEDMRRFIQLTSKPFRNGWYSYAKSIIENFPISAKVLEH